MAKYEYVPEIFFENLLKSFKIKDEYEKLKESIFEPLIKTLERDKKLFLEKIYDIERHWSLIYAFDEELNDLLEMDTRKWPDEFREKVVKTVKFIGLGMIKKDLFIDVNKSFNK